MLDGMPNFHSTDGTRLAYEEYGEGAPVVFIASWALHADMWEYQIPYFAERGYRCVALDRRGHGRSDRPSGGYDLDTLTDDIAALLDHLDLRGVTLAGHSFGGVEVAHFLGRHGTQRVARVAYVASMLPCLTRTDDNPEGVPGEYGEASVAALRADRPRWFADRAQGFFATHLGNDASPALIEETMRQCLSASPWALVAVQRTMWAADERATLRAARVPTLVVHGTADQSALIDVTGRRLPALVPGCVYLEYPAAGHGLYATHRDTLNADLLEFLKD